MDLHSVTAFVPASHPRDFADGDAWLAGGTFLFSEPQPAVHRLLDLSALAWPALSEGQRGLEIAATATIEELTRWAGDHSQRGGARHRAAPLVLSCADAFWAGWKIQALASVGGNVVTALPAAPMVSLFASLDAVATCWAPDGGIREVPVAELVVGDHTTSLRRGELVRSFTVPPASLAARTAMRRRSLTPLGRSAVLVIARVDPADGSSDGGAVVLTCTAATKRPVQLRWPNLAAVDDAAGVLDAMVSAALWHDDVHGLPQWRRAMALVAAAEVIEELRGEAR